MITQHGGDTAPDFTVATQNGMISLQEWAGNSWAFRFGHPADCTPLCTMEMGRTAQLAKCAGAIVISWPASRFEAGS